MTTTRPGTQTRPQARKRTREIPLPLGIGDCATDLDGSGMPALVMKTDWATTPIGARATWPKSLATAVNICLGSHAALAVCWGPQLTFIYNDSFAVTLGDRHPRALGQPYHDVFAELSHVFEPLVAQVLSTGTAAVSDSQMLLVDRNGYQEEAHFAFSLSPIDGDGIGDDATGVGGVFITAVETTANVLNDRRMRALRELAQLADARGDLGSLACRVRDVLDAHAADVPFSLIYVVDDPAAPTRLELVPMGLADRQGHQPASMFAPAFIDLVRPESGLVWPVHRVMKGGRAEIVRNLGQHAPTSDTQRVHTAVVQPLYRQGSVGPLGVLVTGTSPRRVLDAGYLDFLELAASHVGGALAMAHEAPSRSVCPSAAIADPETASDPQPESDGDLTTPPLTLMLEATERALAVPNGEDRRADIYDLFCQAPAPFCVLRGPTLVFETANPAYIRLFGHPDIIGKPLIEALPEARTQGTESLLLGVMRTGVPYVGQEVRAGTASRSGAHPPIWPEADRSWTLIYSPLRSRDGIIDRVMVFAWEVTDQVRARVEIERARQQAEEASLAKDQFLAMLGHELRNPLSPILTALQLMQLRGMRSREQEVIERQVGHLVRLVDDLLDIARITRGKVELRREPLQLASIVVRGIEQASPLLEQRKQRLIVNVAPDGLLVSVDADRLAQVLSNLLTNASKYSEPGSRIYVSAERAGDRAVLTVRDEGIGIAPDMLDSIFESFVQHRQSSDRAAGGLGLGLAIVRTLVRLHGGNVRAHSDGPGTGSEFRVDLPLSDGVHIVEASGESERVYLHDPAEPQGAERILVVDDNHDGAEILAEVLRELGHTVEIAHDGPAALAMAARFKPQLALLDIGLPVMDGYELAGHLRAQFPAEQLRLVAVTGYGQETDRRRTAAAGFSAHVVKPVDLDVLTAVVRHDGLAG